MRSSLVNLEIVVDSRRDWGGHICKRYYLSGVVQLRRRHDHVHIINASRDFIILCGSLKMETIGNCVL